MPATPTLGPRQDLPILGAMGFLLFVLSMQLPGHYPPWVSFQQQAMAALGMSMVAACAAIGPQHDGTARLSISASAAFVVGLAAVPLLQHAFGLVVFRSDAVMASLYLVGAAACIVAGQTLASSLRGRAWLDAWAWSLLTAAILACALAFVQWFAFFGSWLVVDLKPGDRPYANLAQPNHLATVSFLGVLAVVRQWERGRLGAVASWLLLLLLTWGIVLTQSRTAWLYAGLLLVWWVTSRKRAGIRLSGAALLAGLALFAAGVMLLPWVNDALLLSSSQSLADRITANTRIDHWTTLWDAAWRHPWVGYGWGQVVRAQQAAVLDHAPANEWLLQSHNLVLDLMIYLGALPGLAVSMLLASWVIWQIRAVDTVDGWWLMSCVGALLTHALLEYPLDYLYFLLPLALMVGLLEGLQRGPFSRLIAIPRAAYAGGLAVVIAGGGLVAMEYVRVEESIRQGRFVMLRIGVSTPAPLPAVVLLDQPVEFLRYMMTPAQKEMPLSTVNWMRDVASREPRPPALLRYALAAGLNGQPAEAERALKLVCQLHGVTRCDEGRASWLSAAQQWPELAAISYPATPPNAPR